MRQSTKTLILTVGLPRSGKTTWARKQGIPIVCPDEIRKAIYDQRFIRKAEPLVWYHAKVMVESLFGAGHDKVIVDATHTKKNWRLQWLSSQWKLKYKVFNTSKEVCIARAKEMDDDEIIPVILRYAIEFERPVIGEKNEEGRGTS